MSDTPRTEEEWKRLQRNKGCGYRSDITHRDLAHGMFNFAETLERELYEMTANHNNQVRINRLLRDRPDLGDRAKLVDALITEISELKNKDMKTEKTILEEVRSVVIKGLNLKASVANRSDIDTLSLEELNADSLDVAEILTALHQSFEVELMERKVDFESTISSIAKEIEESLSTPQFIESNELNNLKDMLLNAHTVGLNMIHGSIACPSWDLLEKTKGKHPDSLKVIELESELKKLKEEKEVVAVAQFANGKEVNLYKADEYPSGIEKMVCDDITARQEMGVKKYGTTVEQNPIPLREWLQHAYEESLDKAVYLKRAIKEMDDLSKKQ